MSKANQARATRIVTAWPEWKREVSLTRQTERLRAMSKELTEQQLKQKYKDWLESLLVDDRDQLGGFDCYKEGFRSGRESLEIQIELMRFDPQTGEAKPFPSRASDYREWHGRAAWLYNPWTGKPRSTLDIGSDATGLLLLPEEPSE